MRSFFGWLLCQILGHRGGTMTARRRVGTVRYEYRTVCFRCFPWLERSDAG